MKWTIPYRGKDWVFDDERITASEARIQKRATEGMTPAAAERARLELDPDSWVAALLIAMRRGGENIEGLEVDADDIDLMACSRATEKALRAGTEQAKTPAAAEPEKQPAV